MEEGGLTFQHTSNSPSPTPGADPMEAALLRMKELGELIKPGVASGDVVRRLIEFGVLKAVNMAQTDSTKKSAAYVLRTFSHGDPLNWLQNEKRREKIYGCLSAALDNVEVRKSVAAFLIPTGSGDLTAEECVDTMVKLVKEALPDDIDQLGPNVLNSEEFAARVNEECELGTFLYLPHMDEQVMTLFLLLVPTGHLDVISQFNFAPTTTGNRHDEENKGCDAVAKYVARWLTTGTTHGKIIHQIRTFKYKGLKRDNPVLNGSGLSIQLANRGRSNGSVDFVLAVLQCLSTLEGAKYDRFHMSAAYAMLASIASDKNVDHYPDLKACIKNACHMALDTDHEKPELLSALQLVMPTSEDMLSAAENEESMVALWPLLYGVYNKKAQKVDPQGFFSSKERMLKVSPTATGGKKRKRKEDEEKEEDDEEEDDESDFTDDEEE